MDPSVSKPAKDETDLSLESLKAKARSLYVPGSDRMNRDELLYEILKAQGGDGGLGI